MLKRFIPFLAFIGSFFLTNTAWSQVSPKEVSVCELARDPKVFDGKVIRVRGTLSVHFEDFSLVTTDCNTQQGIWLAFGGDVPGIVPSTANDNSRKVGANAKVNGVPYKLKKDENFRKLYALIAAVKGDEHEPIYTVTATLNGAFFAARGPLAGYGHLGCCSLFMITEVGDVDSVPPADLTVRGTVLGPDGMPEVGFVVLSDVRGGSPPQRQQAITNSRGEFEFSNSGQLLRFENPKYRPIALPVETGGPAIEVKLEFAQRTDWVLPPCSQIKTRNKRIGFSILFTLPPTMSSKRLKFNFGQTDFVFPQGKEPGEARFLITHHADDAAQHSSSVGYERPEQRWIKNATGGIIGIESSGREKDGGHWRNILFWTDDNAYYSLDSGEDTSVLDRILDSACIAGR